MASFLAVLLAAVALLAAGRMGHAAPSRAEMIWRAVLKSSVVPNAVLRRLQTDTSMQSKGMVGMTKQGAGRSTSDLGYDDYTQGAGRSTSDLGYDDYTQGAGRSRGDFGYNDYTRLPPTAGNAAPYNNANQQAPSEGSGVRDDDVPFNYSYKQAPSEADEATRVDEDDGPFGYDYKAPSDDSERRADGGKEKATTTVFFHEEAVRVGERLHFRFPAAAPAPLGFLPRHAADSIPFSTPALPSILALFRVSPGSAQAAGMAETLRTCEYPPLAGESKFCASSVEALVERAMATLRTRDVRAVTSTLPRAGAPLQPYTVRAVRRVDGASFVACHDEVYPYTVYRCHTTGPARAYMMEMEGAGGAPITMATVCHTDTSRWNPEHLSFKLLGTKPGGAPICHLMPYGHIIWAKNVKQSPA